VTNPKLASELAAVSTEFNRIQDAERAAAIEVEQRFAEDQEAIRQLLSFLETKHPGAWCNTSFNIFAVLGRPRLEQAHSNFLAWLLNPQEAHGLGDQFLREFMQRALRRRPPNTSLARVVTEYKWDDCRFDVLVSGPDWRLIVENKIWDTAWLSQCEKYQKYCEERERHGGRAWLVYVTPHLRQPRGVPYWLSYKTVASILERLMPCAASRPIIGQFCEHVFVDLET